MTAPTPDPQEALQEAKAAFKASLEDLQGRLHPKSLLEDVGIEGKRLVNDLAALLTTGKLPQEGIRRKRNVKLALGLITGTVVFIAIRTIRKR